MTEDQKVTVEMSVYHPGFFSDEVRASLFNDTKEYTYDPKCVPERVVQIRDVIVSIDEQLDER